MFLYRLGSLDFDGIAERLRGRWAFVTLTWRDDPGSAEVKRSLGALEDRLRRRLPAGRRVWTWKLEFQRRGVPHLHLLVFVPGGQAQHLTAMRFWLWGSWAEITGGHNRVDVDWCRARDVARYIAFDLTTRGKSYQFRVPDDWGWTGRWWGLSADLRASVEWRVVELDRRALVSARRTLRRYRQATSSFRCRFGRHGAQGRMWVIGSEVGSLSGALVRAMGGP